MYIIKELSDFIRNIYKNICSTSYTIVRYSPTHDNLDLIRLIISYIIYHRVIDNVIFIKILSDDSGY